LNEESRAARVRKTAVNRVTSIVTMGALLASCAYVTPTPDLPSATPQAQVGTAPTEVEQVSEAKALEQAEAKCASEGKHAVAHRLDNGTVYDCAATGDSGSGNPPQP
jgi:hypothetical protein